MTHFDETAYLEPGHASAAIRRLRPGQSVVFAAGPRLADFHPTVKLIKDAAARGEVTLHSGGRDEQGRLRHVARRPVAVDSAAPPRPALRENYSIPEGRLMRVLREVAEAGQPCPSNADLADLAELADRYAAKHRLNVLVRAGRIAVRTMGDGSRVVRLLDLGIETA